MTTKNTRARDANGIDTQPISVRDRWGAEHDGLIARVERFEGEIRTSLVDAGHDFLIVLLSESDDTPPGDATTVFCTPSDALPATIREEAPEYVTGASDRPAWLTPRELRLYRDGRFVSSTDLHITPQDVFGEPAGGFTALASALIGREQEATLLAAIARALSAPHETSHRTPDRVLSDLRRRFREAARRIKGSPDDVHAYLEQRLERVRKLASSRKPETAIAAATSVYTDLHVVVEDVFFLRALIEHPDDAISVLRMQGFLEAATVPDEPGGELALDRKMVSERLRFATLVADPGQLPGMTVSFEHFEHFERRYCALYAEHHSKFWEQTAGLAGLVAAAKHRAEALHRLNTISELGPPLEMESLVEYGDLLDETPSCRLATGRVADFAPGPICHYCHITLADAPNERAREVLDRIERGISGQMKRLASAGVRQVLRRSGDPRIERFLKVVQAAQGASLADVLDDELTGYIRRFLVEARLGVILEPLLTHVAHGTEPDQHEARSALRDVAGVIETAFETPRLALPDRQPPSND